MLRREGSTVHLPGEEGPGPERFGGVDGEFEGNLTLRFDGSPIGARKHVFDSSFGNPNLFEDRRQRGAGESHDADPAQHPPGSLGHRFHQGPSVAGALEHHRQL